jgi:HK97 family phage major capsid protein
MLNVNEHAMQDRLATQMRDMMNRSDDGGGKWTSSEREKYKRMETDWDSLEAKRTRQGPGPATVSDVALPEFKGKMRAGRGVADDDPYEAAFANYIRVGQAEISDDVRSTLFGGRIRNAMTTTSSTGGGALVPEGFSQTLEVAAKWFGGIDGVCQSFETETGNTMPWPSVNDSANMGRFIGQNVSTVETDLVFGTVTFSSYIASSDLILIPLALAEDSFFPLEKLAADLLGTRLGRLKNKYCTIGTGTNQPTGILTAALASCPLYTMATGSTAGPSYADLLGIEHTLDPSYRYASTCRWMFNDLTLKHLKGLLDSQNRPLWQPGLTASFQEGAAVDLLNSRPTILNHPYIINQDMPTPVLNANSIVFGDMSKFVVRKVASGTTLLVLRERYAEYLQLGMTAFQRYDSNLVDAGTHPLVVGVNSAS